MIFTFVGDYTDPALAHIAQGLRAVFQRRGHEYTSDPEAEDLRLVVNFIDAERPKPYRRRPKAIFVLSVPAPAYRPHNVLRQPYPLLPRSRANLCLYLV